MTNQKGVKTTKLVWGEFFVEKYGNNPERNFTISELQDEAKQMGVNPNNIIAFVKREFADMFVIHPGGCTLKKDWGVNGLLDAVNSQRLQSGFKPLELPKPNPKEISL